MLMVRSILFVVTGLAVGGAEHVVANLADKAKADGYDVKIAYLTGEVSVAPKHKSIELVALGMTSYASFFVAFWRLRCLVKAFRPDVVHSHMIHANLLARLSRLWIRIPRLICSAHSSNEGGRLRMLAYRLTHSLGDVFTNVSEAAACALEESNAAPKGSVVAVLNGVDVRYFYPEPKRIDAQFTLIAVGRLDVAKDYPNLLHATNLVRRQRDNFKLQIIGDGSRRVILQEMTESLGLTDKVEWLGIRRDIPRLLNRADCFVLSSAWEGFGLVVAEAMACGLPVVATDCGGVKEVLGGERWLVPPKDPQALAEKVIEIMQMTDEQRLLLGKANRRRIVDLYSIDAMFQGYKKLYLIRD